MGLEQISARLWQHEPLSAYTAVLKKRIPRYSIAKVIIQKLLSGFIKNKQTNKQTNKKGKKFKPKKKIGQGILILITPRNVY